MRKGLASIERGTITAVSEGEYTIASQDREGIETLPVPAMDERTYAVGDEVDFFLFADGTGAIICKRGEKLLIDYDSLKNRPKIEGTVLTGDKTFQQLGLTRLSDSDIDELLEDEDAEVS